MTSRKLRLLADSLENNFITAEDRKGWITDLRGLAKQIERAVLVEPAPPGRADNLAARIVDELRDKYSIRLPARGVLEFVSRERLIRTVAHVIELEGRMR